MAETGTFGAIYQEAPVIFTPKIWNPARTFLYTITGGAITADRTLNLPVITGTDTLAALGLAQTWTALQSFGTNLGGTLQTAAQPNVTSLGTLTGLTMGGALGMVGQSITGIGTLQGNGVVTIETGVTNQSLLLQGGNATDTNGAQIALYGFTHANAGALLLRTPDTAGLKTRLTLAGNAVSGATVAATWAECYHVSLKFGLAGTATGAFTMDGATSGVVTMTVAAVAGTWTMTLPAAVPGTNGDQLSALTSGVCSWTAAGSLREFKNILLDAAGLPRLLDPRVALQRILATPTEIWTYKRDAPSTTGDFETEYTALVADKAPWAMHHEGRIFSPENAFGHTLGAFQALHKDLQKALAEIAGLKTQVAALSGA